MAMTTFHLFFMASASEAAAIFFAASSVSAFFSASCAAAGSANAANRDIISAATNMFSLSMTPPRQVYRTFFFDGGAVGSRVGFRGPVDRSSTGAPVHGLQGAYDTLRDAAAQRATR